jgi:soluble cytochrome b562
MKIRSTLALLIALPIVSPILSAADAPASPPSPAKAASAGKDDDQKTELETRMDRIGKAFRKLKKQVADPAQNASSLQLLATMQDAAKEAVDFTPAKAADLPEDQRPKFVEDFKAGIKGMLDEFSKLADALTAGKNEDAVKIVSDIDELEKKDHKEFKKPKKD